MDLKLFLDPVSSDVVEQSRPPNSFQDSIFINHEIMFDLDGIEIVLLGVTEARDSYEKTFDKGPDEIRKKLYALTKTSGRNRILDLGNLRNGPTTEETIKRLQEVLTYLLDRQILPVIIGGSHDIDLGQYMAYESTEKLVTLLNVDARMDLEDSEKPNHSHVSRIFKHSPNFLFNYIHLGYQTYFVDQQFLDILERLSFEKIRLGEIREGLTELEPIIRDADLLSFDVSSIASSFCPGTGSPNPFGLSGEEACQVCWYAGLNDKLSSVGFYEYNPEEDDKHFKTASVIATMIWYFIDGFYHRKGDRNFMSNDYLIYEVPLGGNPDSIRFYKSKLSEKWWIEIPDDNSDSVFLRSKMIPCSYQDYQKANEGEVPERWLKAINKS